MDRTSFDNQLFTWEKYNPDGPNDMQFANVELKVQVGSFPAGTKFPFALLLGSVSLLVLIDEKDEEHGFDLKLNVGEKVEPPEHDEDCECGHDHHH